jgi:hypothetical protein
VAWLLFPGRHHLLTRFQMEELKRLCALAEPRIEGVVWAVTSANHEGTRRNPLPAHRREAAIERAAAALPVPSLVYHVDDLGATTRFAEYVLKKVEVESGGRLKLRPANTVVGCSTPEVAAQYKKLGFSVLPFEAGQKGTATPWQVLQSLVAAGGKWRADKTFAALCAPESRQLYLKYGLGDVVVDLHRHPILTEDGDLTATRDYNTYARSFDEGAERKYDLIKDYVVPGRIVDIGCCAGAVLRLLSKDGRLRESDLYGVEVARPLYRECLHRKENGAFGNDNVFFYHADAVGRELFSPRSVTTFTTFALTHELFSYQGPAPLNAFIKRLRGQIARGGRWLNVDVVGPEDGDRTILLELNRDDGVEKDWGRAFKDRKALKAHLEKLSTYGRFLRFSRDFRKSHGYKMQFELLGEGRARLALRDACEFLSKKDYTDNWDSELHEAFCFWGFSRWKKAVSNAGFRVHPASRAFTNPWIAKNRFEGKARLLDSKGKSLPWPPTNMLLIAEVGPR